MQDFLTALALVFVLEGLIPLVAPEAWKKTVTQMINLPPNQLRIVGLVFVVIGLIALNVVRN